MSQIYFSYDNIIIIKKIVFFRFSGAGGVDIPQKLIFVDFTKGSLWKVGCFKFEIRLGNFFLAMIVF